MRKLAILLFLVNAALFISCSNDDDDSPIGIDQNLIPGEWALVDTKSENGIVSTTVQGLPISGNYSISGKDYNASITLTRSTVENEPNTITASGGFTLVATFTLPAQEPIVVEENITDFIGTGEWTVSGNILTTTSQGETLSYEIITLSAQAMILKTVINEERTVETAIGTLTVKITGDQFITLGKQ